jgi:hypothetical protein
VLYGASQVASSKTTIKFNFRKCPQDWLIAKLQVYTACSNFKHPGPLQERLDWTILRHIPTSYYCSEDCYSFVLYCVVLYCLYGWLLFSSYLTWWSEHVVIFFYTICLQNRIPLAYNQLHLRTHSHPSGWR